MAKFIQFKSFFSTNHFKYLSKINCVNSSDSSSNFVFILYLIFLEYIINFGNVPLKFGNFPTLETPNKVVSQVIILEWTKQVKNSEKLNINSDLVNIICKTTLNV
jgi:hypothetical protein